MKQNEAKLMSRFGASLDRNNVLKEYPRPQLVRDSYLNLNGIWEFGVKHAETEKTKRQSFRERQEDQECQTHQERRNMSLLQRGAAEEEQYDSEKRDLEKRPDERIYDREILVPFSPETVLSGVEQLTLPGDILFYKKTIRLPEGILDHGRHVLLHFGAADQECRVFVNGKEAGEHKGGYLPFSFDVSALLLPEEDAVQVIEVEVRDDTELKPHARGKQKLYRKGKYASIFYTPQSGIWQTVWMEAVPETYVTALRVTPLFDRAKVRVAVRLNRPAKDVRAFVLDGDTVIREAELARSNTSPSIAAANIGMDGFEPWTPESPKLYDLIVTADGDRVYSYFGMRKFAKERDAHGILRFYLNNRPYFFNGVLDQGYWPESLMTAPGDEALIWDIRKAKELGFNTIRKHVKVEADRFYYHCDRLGMIVWQDMPNGGGEYDMTFVTELPNTFPSFGRHVSDHHYKWFRREDEQGRRQYERDLTGMIRALCNHPCIAVWVPFNEGWGQFDAERVTARIRKIDPTRLVNEACGWFDQGGGDLYSIHNYRRRLKVSPQGTRVVAVTEYGGYAYPVSGHIACEKEFGYRMYRSSGELTQHYEMLWESDIFPNVERGLSGAIYTQMSDIEEEVNGLMTYDREIDKFEAKRVRALNDRLYRFFEELT